MQILRPSPYPLPEGEGKSSSTSVNSHLQWFIAKACILAIASCALLAAQTLPLEPAHESGASVTGAFEGWFKNADGSVSLLLGYFNRNTKEEVDVPIGPDNHIDPGGPDYGQPT